MPNGDFIGNKAHSTGGGLFMYVYSDFRNVPIGGRTNFRQLTLWPVSWSHPGCENFTRLADI